MINLGAFFSDIGNYFKSSYKCYSVSMMGDRDDLEKGGKIIMPTSALDKLTRSNIMYPMLFKLSNTEMNRHTHCGVLEFVAEEGLVYLPYWMMKNLLLEEGTKITVENVNLPVATFAKFQPQQISFLDITNPKAVLENALRNFACLTLGDVLSIKYNDKNYDLCVLETKPGNAVSIIECDMNVEFAPPIGYEEPGSHQKMNTNEDEEDLTVDAVEVDPFMEFGGEGNRLDGKKRVSETQAVPVTNNIIRRGIPNYDFKRRTISFIRTGRRRNEINDMKNKFETFSGSGQTLGKK